MKHRRIGLALLACVASVAAACGSSSGSKSSTAATTAGASGSAGTQAATTAAAAQPDRNAILRYGGYTAEVLDPIRQAYACEVAPLGAIFDTLLAFDSKGQIQPRLATSYSLQPNNVLRLTLRPGVTFQDGTPFDADAVKFNVDRAMTDPASTIKSALAAVSSVTVVDPMTVDIAMKQPAAGNLLGALTDRAGMMASPTAVKAAGSSDAFSKAPVGSGMYKVEGAWQPREKITLRAWPGYWDKDAQKLGGIDMKEVAGEAQLNAIQAGDLDLTILDNKPSTSLGDKYNVVTQDSNQYSVFLLNSAAAPIDNLMVRQAIAQAIDRQAIADALTNGTAKAAYQPFPTTSGAYDADLAKLYPYDPAKAKALLAQAGFPNGFDLKAGVGNASPLYLQMGELIAGQLKQVGINMTITQVDQSQAFSQIVSKGQFQGAPYGGQAVPDIAAQFRDYYLKGGTINASHIESPGVADLITQAGASVDQAARADAFKKANQLITQQVQGGVVLYFQPSVEVYPKYVGGVTPGQLACQFNFRGIYITQNKVNA